jgi:hypothetical protein
MKNFEKIKDFSENQITCRLAGQPEGKAGQPGAYRKGGGCLGGLHPLPSVRRGGGSIWAVGGVQW